MKVEVDFLGSSSPINKPKVFCGRKATLNQPNPSQLRAKELCEGRLEVDVLGSPSLIVLTVSVDVKQQ